MRKTTAFDEQSGKLLSCDLKKPKLVPEAIPSLLPNCPAYLSKEATSSKRLSRESILQNKEQSNLARALEESKKEYETQEALDQVSSITDIIEKLELNAPWQMFKDANGLSICYVEYSEFSGPRITCSFLVHQDLSLHAYLQSVKVCGSLPLPERINKLQQIYKVCDAVAAMIKPGNNFADQAFDMTLKLVICLLISLKQFGSSSFISVISFIVEQLQLMTKKSFNYSSEFLVFAAIFHNLSPCGYRFLRGSGNIILPCLTTIRKVTMASSLSPLNEQTDRNFMLYIKHKYKALQYSDITVNLLVDEIHLASFFYYKSGTNMVAWATTNIILNNLCFKKNDAIATSKRQSKKRKLQTLA